MDENKVEQNTGQLSKLEEEKVNIHKEENEEEGLKKRLKRLVGRFAK